MNEQARHGTATQEGFAAGDSTDWNYAAEQAIETGLGMIPEVGSILSSLVAIFWPQPSDNVWAEIEQQVEVLIDQAIDQLVLEQVQNSL